RRRRHRMSRWRRGHLRGTAQPPVHLDVRSPTQRPPVVGPGLPGRGAPSPLIRISAFGECDVADLYRILQLRSSVFAVEQQAVYNDLDGQDLDATLLWVEEEGA